MNKKDQKQGTIQSTITWALPQVVRLMVHERRFSAAFRPSRDLLDTDHAANEP